MCNRPGAMIAGGLLAWLTIGVSAGAGGEAGRQVPSAGAPARTPASQVRSARATIAEVGWMAGVWVGSVGSSTAEERWTPPAGATMLGVARTVRNDRLTGFEFLRITEREGTLVYAAMPNGRSPATEFILTRVEARSVTFENPAHDFPKVIRYSLGEDGVLEAVVSGDPGQRPQTFRFERQQSSGW